MCVSIYYSKHLPIRNCGGKKGFDMKIKSGLSYIHQELFYCEMRPCEISVHMFLPPFSFPDEPAVIDLGKPQKAWTYESLHYK